MTATAAADDPSSDPAAANATSSTAPAADVQSSDSPTPGPNAVGPDGALRRYGTETPRSAGHAPQGIRSVSEGTSDGAPEDALEAGATAYIKKPFHSEEILEVINRLEKKGAA